MKRPEQRACWRRDWDRLLEMGVISDIQHTKGLKRLQSGNPDPILFKWYAKRIADTKKAVQQGLFPNEMAQR